MKVPADKLLAELIIKHKHAIWKIHDHDSLLEHQVDQEISGNIANGNYPLIVHHLHKNVTFLTFPACLKIPIFSNFNSNCFSLLDMRNLQEQVKKAF